VTKINYELSSLRNFLLWSEKLLNRRRQYTLEDKPMARGDEWAVFRYGDKVVLIIDGTRGLREWYTNLSRGGWRASTEKISSEYRIETPDIIVGFSRGGVLGLMLAEQWGVAKVVCFSTPKAAAYQLTLKGIPLFIESAFDLVSDIPPSFVRPTPLVLLEVSGMRHGVADISKIPAWKISLIELALKWNLGEQIGGDNRGSD
jgi:hypothetical protein